MAWAKSGLYYQALLQMLNDTSLTGTTAGTGPWLLTTGKIGLHTNSLVDGTAPINFSAATISWANTNEVSDATWTAGGRLFSTAAAGSTSIAPAFSESPAGTLKYAATNVSVASTSLSNVRGCIFYADAITGPASLIDMMLVAVTFGADYTTVSGTFGITWDANGIFTIDFTP